jgi:hypothetical protein
MQEERVVKITLFRRGDWVSGKVSVSPPGEGRAPAWRAINARVEEAPGELSELAEWALTGSTAQQGFWA